MSDPNERDPAQAKGNVVRFPQSRRVPTGSPAPYKVIGTSAFAKKYGAPVRQATGHWCSGCRGIWFGYLLEVTCPACGNRRG